MRSYTASRISVAPLRPALRRVLHRVLHSVFHSARGRRLSLVLWVGFLACPALIFADAPAEPRAESQEATAASTAAEPSDRARATFAFSRAKLLADGGRLVEAAQAFDEALRLDPSDPYAFSEAAKFHLYLAQISRQPPQRTTHLERAAELAERARALAPANPDTLRIYGDIHMRMAELQPDALAKAQEAFRVLAAEDDLQALTSLAQIELWQRNAPAAVEILRRASNLAPNHRIVQSMLVEALLGAGETSDAAPALAKLLELDPTHLEGRIRLAEILSDQGAHDRAVEVLRAAPEDFTQKMRLRQLLTRELHLAGEHREALAISDELLAEEPRSSGFYRLRMSILASLARYDEAIALFDPEGNVPSVEDFARERLRSGDLAGVQAPEKISEKISILVPAEQDLDRHVQDVLLLARLEERVGRIEPALDRVRRVLERAEEEAAKTQSTDGPSFDDRQAKIRLALAGILQRDGRYDEAAEQLEPLLGGAEGEDLALVAQSLAEVKAAAGEHEAAAAVLDRATARLEEAGRGQLASALRLRQTLDLAADEQWSAVAANLGHLEEAEAPEIRQAARQLRAESLAHAGRIDEAVAVLGRGDEDPQLRAKRLQLMLEHGRETLALSELESLAAGGDPDDLLFVARVLQSEERHELAVPYLHRLETAQPESVQVLFMLGAALERTGDLVAATEIFERVLALAPDHAPTLNYLGYMWAERKENLEHALDLILQAVAQQPDNGAYVDSLGWVLYQLGRYDEARRHLEWAARLVDDDPTIHHHLGDVYLALDEPEAARASFRRALELSGSERAGELDAVERADVERKLEKLSRSGP